MQMNLVLHSMIRWIGLARAGPSTFAWLNQTTAGTAYLNPRMDGQAKGDCVLHSRRPLDGKPVWTPTDCTQKQSFVCKRCLA